VLSNGAGAASQVRLAWGEIRSQYDAFLAANPNPDVPSDRLNLWTRTRCWLQREGYTREIDSRCLTRVTADPAGRFARWQVTVPCGLGRTAAFDLTLSLVPGVNEAHLTVTRTAAGRDDADGPVRLVFRPDIEWRSFHATTKAFAGAETLFPEAATPTPTGFVFAPYGDRFAFRVTGGVYHHEPEWTYNVAHPEEAARGQDGAGDLFSPGWVSADLDVGARVTLTGAYAAGTGADDPFAASAASLPAPETEATLPVAAALRRALDLYIVKRDGLKTVIAGYPWFLDWGRDTFIFMRGLIAAGMVGESVKILKAFAAFEEKGTLPNIIYGTVAGNRDTTDAPLWFVRCVREIDESRRPADGTTAAALRRLRATCERIVSHYRAGTPNGIHVDPASGLVWSPSHFTWMDTNNPACTPRVGYPVEIQALWISALDYLGLSAEAARARASLERYFRWEHGYRDCLAAPAGEPAAAATPEETIRPNQLFLITLGVTDDRAVLRATEELLVPGGIRSLQAGHALYKGVYAGDEDTCRKPAYHNGTVWAWPFPLYAEAMVETGAWTPQTACSLLASAVENLNAGTLCHMSENADGDAPHAQKGCTAQAWSDSELLRVWLKLQARPL
jgi:predicted glycogen debranching enzyme